MKNVFANARFWTAGIITAFAGVALARFVGPSLVGPARAVTVIGGQLLAMLGLLIICIGVRRRIKQPADQ